MGSNQNNQKDQLPRTLAMHRKAEFGRIIHKIQQNSSEEIAQNMEDKGILIGYIQDDFEKRKETFIPAEDTNQ